MHFLIEQVLEIAGKCYVLARKEFAGEPVLGDAPLLGGVEVENFCAPAGKFKADGSPDTDVYSFILVHRGDANAFFPGLQVELENG